MDFKQVLFGTGDFNTMKRKMSSPGNERNFPRTKGYIQNIGLSKIAAVFGAVAFTAIGVAGLLDFFFPEPQRKNNFNNKQRR